MAKFWVRKSCLENTITIPSSKSHTLRAILFAALGRGKSYIHHYLDSTDSQAMIRACKLLGASIKIYPRYLEIEGLNGTLSIAEDVIDAGNSGIVLRFCSAIAALSTYPIVITGDDSIRHQRPMQALLNGLSQLGVSAISTKGDGYAPVIIQGPLQGGKTQLFGQDSQPVSALLIAAAFAKAPTEIEVQDPGEKPWVALTLDWFDRLGIAYQNDHFERYFVSGQASYPGFEYIVPGDFSSAAFPLAAAVLTQSSITLSNLDIQDSQGDKEIISILQRMGARIDVDSKQKTLHIKPTEPLQGISIDVNTCIDALPILAVIGCFAEGETHLYNGAVARQKECDRLKCIATELTKMGANLIETEDGLKIKKSRLQGTDVYSHHDHRIAMALAVAGMAAVGETAIHATDCVNKTYPSFLKDLQALGVRIYGE